MARHTPAQIRRAARILASAVRRSLAAPQPVLRPAAAA
jgi:hypothetical protein